MRRLLVGLVVALALCASTPVDARRRSGDDCMKSVERPAGIAYSRCYNIEPWRKQRIRVRLFDFVTDSEVVRFGPWVTENGLESIKVWDPGRYLFLRAKVVVVYA